METLDVVEDDEGALLRIRVKTRASKSGVGPVAQGLLTVSVTAPPVDGQANDAAIRALAAAFGVARSAVTLVSGHKSRQKRVRIRGLDAAQVRARLRAVDSLQ